MIIYVSGHTNHKKHQDLVSLVGKLGYDFTTKDEKGDYLQDFTESHDRILAADAMIVDVDSLDEGNGYEIALSSKLDKPTLVLSSNGKLLDSAKLFKSKKITVKEYKSSEDLEKILTEFLNMVKDTLDAKLFMIIPPTVNKYLDWIATHTTKSKSDVVRSAVEDVARLDKEYQSFLKKYQR
ncbi:hypothetical protein HGA91_06605 [candidate division WWE3 bacterium]|nr:hypothetical protein [candidate division WWE3 bacterium]